MSAGTFDSVVRHVRDLVGGPVVTDRELLARFVASRDDEAFAGLVHRHGPMVLGACRRDLGNAHDAEDACQATFLILARKAASVRGHDNLAGWLHRVAVRVAGRLRRDVARRRHEPLPADVIRPESSTDLSWAEVRAAFDDELARLPDRFRLPLLHCYLLGKTRDEAARELGWTVGTVRGRLDRGRKILQSRFARRGLTLSAALIPTLLDQPAGAVSVSLGPTISPMATALAEGVLTTMLMAKIKVAVVAVAACALIGTLVAGHVAQPAAAQPAPAAAQPAPTAPSVPVDQPPSKADEFQENLNTFILRMVLSPKGEGQFDPKFELTQVLLLVPPLNLDEPANGPSGKPSEARVRIQNEDAAAILTALKAGDFFTPPAKNAVVPVSGPHATISIRYQNGDEQTRFERIYAWNPAMLKAIDAIRVNVNGNASKVLDELLKPLAEQRLDWDRTSVEVQRRKLQGTWDLNWIEQNGNRIVSRDAIGLEETARCVIFGNNIALKLRVQITPRFDLDVLNGTFDMSFFTTHRVLTVDGRRERVTKSEAGKWALPFLVTDTELRILLPEDGSEPPKALLTRANRADRLLVFSRVPDVATSWIAEGHGVAARLRTTKVRLALGEPPIIDMDLRGRKGWNALHVLARVEVDGTWYVSDAEKPLLSAESERKDVDDDLPWIRVTLDGQWVKETAWKREPLKLTPGKHKIRIGFRLSSPKGDTQIEPIGGPLEFVVGAR